MVLCPLYSVRNCGNSWREGWKREREGFEYRAVRGGWVSELSVFIPSFNSFSLIALTRKNKKPSVSGQADGQTLFYPSSSYFPDSAHAVCYRTPSFPYLES